MGIAVFMDRWKCNSVAHAAWTQAKNREKQKSAEEFKKKCLKAADQEYKNCMD